jgi:putative ATP-dependent endonuclease of OLD family
MLAYPELYFARFVLLVEGDSERVVLPRLARALDLLIDPAFVAIVPLGGRHVHHFWRLLSELGIPYATLLDLDLGRDGGGFGRVKTALKQLIASGVAKEKLLALRDGSQLTDEALDSMHGWDAGNLDNLESWVNMLENHGVFFSSPLDLDLAMLSAFPEAYEATIPSGGGPRSTLEKATEAVLGTTGPGATIYTGPFAGFPALLPTYRYHFLTRSKPATHLAALAHLNRKALGERMPPVLGRVLKHIGDQLRRD